MSITDWLNQDSGEWMKGVGPESDVVISSRIRLARNIHGIPFPAAASPEQLNHVLELVQTASANLEEVGNLEYSSMADLEPRDRQILMERHLISPQHLEDVAYKGIVLREDEAISVMINEEDHLRLQVLGSGLQLNVIWQLCSQLDDGYDRQLEYAYSDELGFLSACPTNLGTGLRASVMIHLPALVITNQIGKVLATIGQFGFTVRGLYGEGTEAVGNIYQLSNQVSLGPGEEEIISHLDNMARQMIHHERQAREQLVLKRRLDLEDRIYRSYGILAYGRKFSSQEAMEHLSAVRLGIDLELIKGLEPKILQEVLINIQPGHLQKALGREMSPAERDVQRATLIRSRIKF